jgi:glutathione S-transferase
MILKQVGVSYTERVMTDEEWPEKKAGGFSPNSMLPVLEEDGKKISSTPAIAYHLAEAYDLLPDTAEGRYLAIGLIDHVEDFKNGHHNIIWYEEDSKKAREWWVARKTHWLGYIETLLSKNPYPTGSKLSYADICVFQLLHDMFIRPFEPAYKTDLDATPKVKAFVSRVLAESPNIVEHIKTRPKSAI